MVFGSLSKPKRGRPEATRCASSAHVPTWWAVSAKLALILSISLRGTRAYGPPIGSLLPGARNNATSEDASRISTRNINFMEWRNFISPSTAAISVNR